MKVCTVFCCLILVLILAAPSVFAEQEEQTILNYSLWAGAHYTGFEDYGKKIGEYNRGEDEAYPELIFDLTARNKDGYLKFKSHFYDENNILASISAKKGNRVKFTADYISLIHQDGHDMLANLEAREWLGTSPGGKMITHELQDMGADYNTDRHQIQSSLEILLSKKNNIRMSVNHRSIIERGTEQKLSISHCFSCHVVSQEADLEQATHQVEAGLEGEVGDFNVGYFFGYRTFESTGSELLANYDPAVHPINGGSGAEFTSRLIYDGEELPYGLYPETEKMSHTGRLSGRLGAGKLAGSLGYTTTENKTTTLTTDSWNGALNYAMPLNKKLRLVGKVNAMRLMADNVFIDLPTWRSTRPDNHPVNFDYTRFSSVARIQGTGTLELIAQLDPKTSVSFMGGYQRSERVDYPTPDDPYTTNKYIGQFKVRHRANATFSGALKYRYEKTTDPLRSERGLLEAMGRYDLDIITVGTNNWAFYYQREDLRYLNVTSLPTDKHVVDVSGSIKPRKDVTMNLGVTTSFDQNTDFELIDVNHYSVQPNVNLTMIPSDRVMLNAGYNFNYAKSTGPVAIPMFDG